MPHPKHHPDRVYQAIDEPGSGSIAVGYVRSSAEAHVSMSVTAQKQCTTDFAERKQWKIVRRYEESEQSARYEDVERRPVFAQLLGDAGTQFHVVICAQSWLWSRSVHVAYSWLAHLRHLRVWWATADGLWDTNKVKRDGMQEVYLLETLPLTQRVARKEMR
jgi:hypothetical protein